MVRIRLSNADAWALVDDDFSLHDDFTAVRTWRLFEGQYAAGWHSIRGCTVLMNRLVWGIQSAHNRIIKHKNGNPLDNRLENLEAIPRTRTGAYYKGTIKLPNGRFRAMTTDHGKSVHLGTYDTRQRALRAVQKAKERKHAI